MCLFIYLRSDEKNTILFREREKEKKKKKEEEKIITKWWAYGRKREREKKKKSLALLKDSKIFNLFTKISFNNFTWKLKTGMNEF